MYELLYLISFPHFPVIITHTGYGKNSVKPKKVNAYTLNNFLEFTYY